MWMFFKMLLAILFKMPYKKGLSNVKKFVVKKKMAIQKKLSRTNENVCGIIISSDNSIFYQTHVDYV